MFKYQVIILCNLQNVNIKCRLRDVLQKSNLDNSWTSPSLAKTSEIDLNAIGIAWQEAATQVMNELGVYVNATILVSRTIYNSDLNCPVGGEATYTICGSLYLSYDKVPVWKNAVIHDFKLIKDEFKQTTITVIFREVTQVCLK